MQVDQMRATEQLYSKRYAMDLKVVRKYQMVTTTLHLNPLQKVYLAYCQPYTYSMLLDDISYLQQVNYNYYLTYTTLGYSLGGLSIPLIKFNYNNNNNNNNCNN